MGLYKDYTWKVKVDDNSVLRYGSREYDGQNRMLTTYSESEKGQRSKMTGVGEQSQSHHLINDFDFLHPANNYTTISK